MLPRFKNWANRSFLMAAALAVAVWAVILFLIYLGGSAMWFAFGILLGIMVTIVVLFIWAFWEEVKIWKK